MFALWDISTPESESSESDWIISKLFKGLSVSLAFAFSLFNSSSTSSIHLEVFSSLSLGMAFLTVTLFVTISAI